MNDPDVTIMHVKSHLQKYRLTLTAEHATRKGEHQDVAFAPASMASDAPSGAEGSSPRTEAHAAAQSEPQDWCYRSLGEEASRQGSDEAARQKLVETIIQQHQMQKELRHQIQVAPNAIEAQICARMGPVICDRRCLCHCAVMSMLPTPDSCYCAASRKRMTYQTSHGDILGTILTTYACMPCFHGILDNDDVSC